MNSVEQAIATDALDMIALAAQTTHLAKGVPTTTSATMLRSQNTVVITFADGKKFGIRVDVNQLNQNAGRA
jgi:hypothetical protein